MLVRRTLTAVLFLLFCSSFVVAQNTINVPADQATIQGAINAAQNGDTVLVAPGTYLENINFNGKNVTLMSSSGAAATIIDGNAVGTVVTINHGETAAVVDGFTIQNGKASSGAGLEINGAAVTIRNNVITRNQGTFAIGIEVSSATVTIQGNTITANTKSNDLNSSGQGGGGIGVAGDSTVYAHVKIIGNTITNNSLNGPGGGISITYFTDAIIQNNYVAGNLGYEGGGIYSESYLAPSIIQNIVLNNTAHSYRGGGGIFAQTSQGAQVQVIGNTLYGNSSDDGPYGIYFNAGSGSTLANNIAVAASGTTLTCTSDYQPGPATISHNIAYNNSGTAWAGTCEAQVGANGNRADDPQFVDAANGNLHLLSGSPAIDAGDISIPQLPTTDFDGAIRLADATGFCAFSIDMGVYESHPAAPGQAAFTPGALHFDNQPVGRSSAPLPVTILSQGQGCYRVTGVQLVGDFSQTNNCTPGVPAGQSCTVQVAFAPTAAGARNGTLAVVQNTNPAAPVPVTLTGTGVVPFGVPSPSSLTFSGQNINTTSAPQAVTVTNSGGDTLTVSAVSISGPFAQTNNCSTPLPPTASCSVQVTFTPTQNGTLYGTLSLTSNSSPSMASVSIKGQGAGPQGILSPGRIQFYQQLLNTTAPARTATLTNVGGLPLTISSVATVDANGNPTTVFAQTNNCPPTLDPQASCSIQITFTPVVVGWRQGYLAVSSNSAPTIPWFALSGYGTDTYPNMVVAPATVDFGNVATGTAAARAVTISNTGNATLNISSTAATSPFSITNSCVGQISPGAQCVLTLNWTPQTVGTQAGSLTINSNMANVSDPFPITGTGVQPNIVFSPAALTFGTVQLSSTSAAQAVTMSNTGGTAFTIGNLTITNSDFVQTDNCPALLQPGANCTVSVVFTPSATGTRNGTLSVAGTPSGPIGTVALSGTGASPAASLSPTSLTFPTQKVFTTTTKIVTLSNAGTAPLSISSIAASGAIVFTQTNDCPAVLDAGAQCSITVSFRPVQSGTYYGNVEVVDDAPGSPQRILLTGTGASPTANVSTTSLTFGIIKVGTSSAASSVTLTNSGSVVMNISSVTAGGDFAQSNNCGSSLAAGASCTIAVTFGPTASGTRTGMLTMNDDAGNGTPQTVSLTGTGAVATGTVSPTSLNFASIPVGTQSAASAVTLTNTSVVAMNIYGIATSGNFAQTNNCTTSLGAGASCTVNVSFVPTAAGLLTGQLTISSDASPATQAVPLSGTGVSATASFNPSSVTFGNYSVGNTSSSTNVTLRNTGNIAMNISSIAPSGDFTQTNNCPAVLAVNASCTVSVKFKPTAGGTRTGSLIVMGNVPGGAQSLPLSGTGLDFAISTNPIELTIARKSSGTSTVTLTSIGGTFPSSVSLACSGLPASTTCSFSPSSIASGGTSSAITIKPAGNAPVGTYTVTVKGSSGSLIRTTNISLTVQ